MANASPVHFLLLVGETYFNGQNLRYSGILLTLNPIGIKHTPTYDVELARVYIISCTKFILNIVYILKLILKS